MQKSFIEQFKTIVPDALIATRNGFSYLSPGAALKLAAPSDAGFVDFSGCPTLNLFGGALVAVEIALPSGKRQRTYLPVLDDRNAAVPLADLNFGGVLEMRLRALVKAIATTCGLGLSIFFGMGGEGAASAAELGVAPDSVLSAVPARAATVGGAPVARVPWLAALAAARITDPSFYWEVSMVNGKPYTCSPEGVGVVVAISYKGKVYRQPMPLVGLNGQLTEASATVVDWNTAVVTALARAIAFHTGYGLSIYQSVAVVVDKSERYQPEASPKDVPAPQAPVVSDEKLLEVSEEATVVAPPTVAAVEVEPTVAPVEAAPVAETTAPVVISEKPQAATVVVAPPAPKGIVPMDMTATLAAAGSSVGDRFRKILKGKTPAELVGLLGKLQVSAKFADIEKPECFAMLVQAIVLSATGPVLLSALRPLAETRAFGWAPADCRELLASTLVANALCAGVAAGDTALPGIVDGLVAAGVAPDRGAVLGLGAKGKAPMETLDLVADCLTTA